MPTFDGLSNIREFLQKYEGQIPLCQRLNTLDVALRATPARWWTVHKRNITTWETCHRILAIRFGEDEACMNYKYDRKSNSRIHIEAWVKAWKHKSVDEWVHLFVHTLDTIPRNWYTETELRRGSENWSLMINGFKLTFGFESEYPEIYDALEVIRTKVFEDGPLPLFNQLDWAAQLENALECYKLAADEE